MRVFVKFTRKNAHLHPKSRLWGSEYDHCNRRRFFGDPSTIPEDLEQVKLAPTQFIGKDQARQDA